MALGDYTKTTYANGTTPAINATNLNNAENKIKELDTMAIGYAGVSGATYTVQATDKTIIVTTDVAVTITIPESLPVGTELKISRTVASTYAVTVARSGSETIEGATSFITHGAFAASTLNDAEVVLKKKTATSWKFVGGLISGSTSEGLWKKDADGELTQRGEWVGSSGSEGSLANWYGTSSGTTYYRVYSSMFPFEFISAPEVVTSGETPTHVESIATSSFSSSIKHSSDPSTLHCRWIAIGRWK